MKNVLEEIGSKTAEVARRARWVRVREDRIEQFARSLPLETLAA